MLPLGTKFLPSYHVGIGIAGRNDFRGATSDLPAGASMQHDSPVVLL